MAEPTTVLICGSTIEAEPEPIRYPVPGAELGLDSKDCYAFLKYVAYGPYGVID